MKGRYMHSVRGLMECPEEEKRRLLTRPDNAVTAYLEDVPEAGEADLLANFGAPEDCAAKLSAECAPAAVAVERRKKNRRQRALTGALAVLLVVALGAAAYLYGNGGVVVINTYDSAPSEWESSLSNRIVYAYGD